MQYFASFFPSHNRYSVALVWIEKRPICCPSSHDQPPRCSGSLGPSLLSTILPPESCHVSMDSYKSIFFADLPWRRRIPSSMSTEIQNFHCPRDGQVSYPQATNLKNHLEREKRDARSPKRRLIFKTYHLLYPQDTYLLICQRKKKVLME